MSDRTIVSSETQAKELEVKKSYFVRDSPPKGGRPTLRIGRRKPKGVMVRTVSRSSNWVRRFSATGLCFLIVIACAQATLGLIHEGKASVDPSVLSAMGILSLSFTRVWGRRSKDLMRILKRVGKAAASDRVKPIVVAQEAAKRKAGEVLRSDEARKKSKKAALNKLVER